MIAREVQAYLAQPQDQNMISAIHEKINTIIEISESVTNTNIFMMMTINRCIDYSKSAHGVKLVPILETMSLQATIDFSLKCLDNLKHMIGIEVTYDLSGIHDVDERNESMAKLFVETDKTWLQENLLCLLGNALQHSKANTLESSKAKIVVEVSLATEMFGFRSGIVNKRCGATHRSSFTVPSILSKKTSKPKFLVMEVLDCGAGLISEEDLQKVFLEPAQAVRYTGGTGLGLYSLAKRVEALGGDYGATKRRDGKSGCIFWFCIPWQHLESKKAAGLANAEVASNNLAKSPQTVDNTTLSFKYAEYSTSKYEGQLDDLEQQVRPAQSVTNSNTVATTTMTTTLPTINMSNRTVLIVDDSYLILKMTSMTLRKLGYDIITAENGAEACALIQQTFDESQKHIDLILMDFQMPIMDGIEAIKQIRNLESSCGNLRKQLPIIGFSAKSDSDQIEAAYSLGMNAFVAKPLTTQVFQDVVKNILVE